MSPGEGRRRAEPGRGAGAVLWVVCLIVLIAPFPVAYHFNHRDTLPPRVSTPAAHVAPAGVASAGLPAGASAPVVLAYHNIASESPSKYSITPEAFEAQMAALAAAGYRSITADEFLDYVDGRPVPRRSVLITFDDGTDGLWTYADEILERHGFTGVSFIITGFVGTRRPYYLTWPQITAMRDSGRWDFGSHTRDLHRRVPIDATGTTGAALSRRRWLPEQDRTETAAEHVERVRGDLIGSIDDMTAHGLPRPQLFAYPFSEGVSTDSAAGDTAHEASAVVHSLFRVSMVNNAPGLTASRRQARRGMVDRLELTDTDTPQTLLAKLAADATPLRDGPAIPGARG